ncbi:hypothetical protein KUH03_01105 [Sphingobacterium sp. E70]|uniref:hypothetical protein n=1 Tax=Sphingobacterium sp. E70 TaxID=2853439 RepID=UPI00211C3610|nr:hypothetical protein [Sphingobacterium sp. E70]ULT25640.1 hypothetical protein KUH03_01105 [Sphingobacterium sp. E70]
MFWLKLGIGYAQRIKTFFEKTGFDIWENDGPFPGINVLQQATLVIMDSKIANGCNLICKSSSIIG